MAITRSFGGQTLLKPGAYSVSRVDNAQSLNVGDNDTIMLIGEATNGDASVADGGTGTSRVFNAANVQSLIDYYVSGDIVDAALAAVRPSLTAGVSGPGQFVVFKTNVGALSFTQIKFRASKLPVAGDIIRFQVPINASGESADVDLTYGTDISLFDSMGTAITMASEFTTNTIAAILASPALQNFVNATADSTADQILLTALKQGDQFNTIKVAPLAPGGVPFATGMGFLFNVSDIAIESVGRLFQGGASNLGGTTTDQLNEAFADAFNFDPNVIVPLWSNAEVAQAAGGITDASATFALSGTGSAAQQTGVTITLVTAAGTATAVPLTPFTPATSSVADYIDAFIGSYEVNANDILDNYTATRSGDNLILTAKVAGPGFNITSGSITQSIGTLTVPVATVITVVLSPIPAGNPNAGTTFISIDAQLAASQLQSHLIQRSSTSVRKEAQGMIGGRFADWRASYDANAIGGADGFSGVTSFLIQAFIQDVRVINSVGALEWKAPHILAAMAAGIRLGTTVGEPLTFKFVNANNVAHHVNTSTGNFSGTTQFKPGFDFNVAIQNGITFTELASGGSRVVVDNTRYVTDDSFIFNRGSVIEAAQFVAKSSRQLLERIFVGNKVSNGAALSLKNVLRNYLIELNADNIITSSTDAPFGFVEESFTVSINGNTADIQVEIKPVQGLDFIFINFTLGNITQQA